jgi:S1-C subfamily serine protease
MTLAERLRVRALQADRVKLSIRRQGRPEPIDVEVPLRRADWYEVPLMPGNPMSAPALGIAYQIPLRIEQVQQGGPAALMGIQGGETIVRAELIPPDPDTIQDEKL